MFRAPEHSSRLVATLLGAAVAASAAPAAAAPTWRPTESRSTAAPSTVDAAAPALAASGDTVLLYTRGTPDAGHDATSSQAEAGVLRPGQPWAPPQGFLPTSGAAASPSVVVADDGRAIGFWSGGTGNLGLFGAVRQPGQARFGDAAKLSGGAVSNSPLPATAGNRAGAVAATWVEGNAISGRRVVVRVRDAGGADFGPEQRLSRGPDGTSDEWGEPDAGATPDRPQVAVAADGAVLVAWSQTDKTHKGTRAFVAVRPAGASAFGAPELLTDLPTTAAPREGVRGLAIGGDGTVAVSLLGAGGVLQVARRAPGAAAFAAPVQVNGSTGTGFGSQSQGAAIAVDDAGRITAAWDTGGVASAGAVQVAAQATAGGPFDPPQALPAEAETYPRGVALAVGPEGDATVAWTAGTINSAATRRARVLAARRPTATAAWAAPKELDARTYGGAQIYPASSPRVGVARDGDVAVAWGWNDSTADQGGSWTARVAALDVAGPLLDAAPATVTAVAGQPVELRANARDRFAAVAGVRWTLGDGATADGDAVRHAYAAAGTYSVRAVATDEHGNAREVTRTVTVAPAPVVDPGPGGGDPGPGPGTPGPGGGSPAVDPPPVEPPATVVPRVTRIALRGRVLSLRASAAGRFRVDVERRTVERVRRKGRLVRRTAYVRVQRLTVTAKRAGTATARIRRLTAGRYRVRVTPLAVRGARTTAKALVVRR